MRLDDEITHRYRESRAAFARGDVHEAARIYRHIRADHAVELYYEVELPEHVMFVHPLGTVLGRATYGDYLVVYNGCSVGSDLAGNRPVLGSGVVLFGGAKVLGKTVIGDNVFVTANTVIQDCVVPDNSVVFPSLKVFGRDQGSGAGNALRCDWKPAKKNVKEYFFGVFHDS